MKCEANIISSFPSSYSVLLLSVTPKFIQSTFVSVLCALVAYLLHHHTPHSIPLQPSTPPLKYAIFSKTNVFCCSRFLSFIFHWQYSMNTYLLPSSRGSYESSSLYFQKANVKICPNALHYSHSISCHVGYFYYFLLLVLWNC